MGSWTSSSSRLRRNVTQHCWTKEITGVPIASTFCGEREGEQPYRIECGVMRKHVCTSVKTLASKRVVFQGNLVHLQFTESRLRFN